jgi:hypothetical protein
LNYIAVYPSKACKKIIQDSLDYTQGRHKVSLWKTPVYLLADRIFYIVQPRTWVITHGHCYHPSRYATLPPLAAAQRYQTIVLLRELDDEGQGAGASALVLLSRREKIACDTGILRKMG